MNTTSKIRRIVIGLVTTGALVACGGSSDRSGSSDGGSSAGGDSEVTIVTVADIPGVDDACEKVLNMIGASGQVIAGLVDPDTASSIISDFVSAVPDEIRSDAEVMADAFSAYVEVFAKYSGDLAAAATDPEAMAALEALDSPEVREANERVTQYLADECGFTG